MGGDGWLKVGDQYLPMSIDGVQVLTPKIFEIDAKKPNSECKLEGADCAEDHMTNPKVVLDRNAFALVDEEEKPVDVNGELREELLPFANCCCRVNSKTPPFFL